MQWISLVALALVAPSSALIRFGCSQLVVSRLDPLVNPGQIPSPHLHQIIGGNSFNVTMDPSIHDLPSLSTCTTCQFTEDLSNYWTAVLFFKAKNGTYKRVPQRGNVGFENSKGGMTVYYMTNGLADYQQASKVTAFKPGFRMLTGNAAFRNKDEAQKFRQLTYTCLQDLNTRYPETMDFPTKPCPAGIMANLRFPTCWDGKNLDSPDHMSHVAYPASGTFESDGPCPDTHPVKLPQLMYETIWDTRNFNDPKDWPVDGSQPFVWSMNDNTGYGTHGDYVFGWKGDALQRAMDAACYVNCPTLKTQSMTAMNACSIKSSVNEDVDSWLPSLPGSDMQGMGPQ
ncbi:putative carbohydrate-binding module family 1 protein [Pleurostoma richardsiae]|uniref:Carbohydrate-binding module family 1 protein n=1 Tax=Pleurostoma richardsiae TaxID=41990 RepID=A0AA38VY80_9PEZI|nr:putative carbohydrate-binding module family 1 protein [Pleurostoma richardsiae]